MKTNNTQKIDEARLRLVEVGGNAFQDLGMGRIVGEILVYLYLTDGESSLDQIGEQLGLSKAAISIAVRQLEALGLVRRVRRPGDRKKYYRTAENIAVALQQGLLSFIRRKIETAGAELDAVIKGLEALSEDADTAFLKNRVKRARDLKNNAAKVVDSPILKFFVKS